ncbi:MAG: MATE family efflux transporter [Ignavibacteria bacterium]|nr:MATE family efflux transporter [Ignavibacteria bacterium]
MNKIIGKFLRSFAGESIYLLLMNVADRVFSFILFIIIARVSYETVYGQIVTMFTLSSVCAIFFDMGLNAYLQREIAAGGDKTDVFSRIFSLGMILFFPYLTVSYLVYQVLYATIPLFLFLISLLIIHVSSLVNIVNKALAGLGIYKGQFTAFLIPRILVSLMFFISLYFGEAIADNMLMLFFLAVVLNLIIVFVYAGRSGIRFSFSLGRIMPVIKSALPLGLAVIFNFLYDKIDVLIISSYRGFGETAYYSAAYGIFKTSSIAFSFLMVSGFTEVSSMRNNIEEVRKFFRQTIVKVLMICLVTALFIYFSAELLIDFFYTDRFKKSSEVLKILSFAIPFLGLNNLTGITINGLGYFKVVMYITLVGLLLNSMLNLFFVPIYGIFASAFITVLTEFLILSGEYFFLRRILIN